MFELPETGFSRSINVHNVSKTILADWVEGSVLFVDSTISHSDVIDILKDNNIYKDEDFATEFVEDAWTELRARSYSMGKSSPFNVRSRSIERAVSSWDSVPAYSFCLFLALALSYQSRLSTWRKQNNSNFIDQGHLFERLSDEALSALGWSVYRTGWASGIQTDQFQKIVANIADHLKERFINAPIVQLYDTANEKGLDIVCHRPFRDDFGGRPVYLVQCASGGDWKDKLKTPDIETWKKIITFSSSPQRGFTMPFALEEEEFFKRCNDIDGMLLDRYRLLSAGADGRDWVSSSLKDDIIDWLKPRLSALPVS